MPPCVNRSMPTFTVSEGRVVYGLGALKNVGADAMQLIADGRGDVPFATLFDLARRVDLKRVGKRPMEMLARAGAFDQLDANRRRVFDSLDPLVAYSAAIHEQRASAQVSLFGEAGEDLPEPRLSVAEDWLPNERLAEEHKAIGFYLSGHPLDDYMTALKRQKVATLEEVTALAEQGACVTKLAGSIAGKQERKSAKGNRFAFIQLSDPTGLYEVTVFSDTLEAARDVIEVGANVVLTVEATMESDQLKLLARSISPVDSVASTAGGMGLRIFIDDPAAPRAVLSVVQRFQNDAAIRSRGPLEFCALDVEIEEDGVARPSEVSCIIGDEWKLNPQIKGAIRSLPGVVMVEEC